MGRRPAPPALLTPHEKLKYGMVRDGIYYALALLAAGLVLAYLLSPILALPLFVLAMFCLYFFRDPDRAIPDGPVAVSPADGRVVSVASDAGLTRVSIFLNIFDVHVNRTPIAGRIADVKYSHGEFLVARRIVFWKKPGDTVGAGERIGLIKFGSRVDVFFGPEWDIAVAVRERVRAGSSIIARRKQA